MLLQMALFHLFLRLSSSLWFHIYMHHIFIQSSADGHLGYFHALAIVKCCNEHVGTYVFFKENFVQIYAQEWDFWVIW